MIDRIENERRDSALRALAAQEGERRRITRELHDEWVRRSRRGGGLASCAGRPVGFMTFLEVGLPATLISLVLATAYSGVSYR